MGTVYYNGREAGKLSRTGRTYIFVYSDSYLADSDLPAISLTLPKRKEPYLSDILFPFFYGLLAEGGMKDIQCRALRIDEDDHLTRLLKTAGTDTIGPVTVKEAPDDSL